jgi:F-type H+-transporting ATPase subunit b
MHYLDKRSEEVRSLIEGTEHDRQQAREHFEQSQQGLRESGRQILKMKEAATKEADEMIRKAREQAKSEALALLEKAKTEIVKETDIARDMIRKDVASLSLAIAEKVLEREITDADHRRLIEQSLKELSGG